MVDCRQYLACFNPRTHEECDSYSDAIPRFLPVSIHALTRSATHTLLPIPWLWKFQSTHSRGVRLVVEHGFGLLSRFNPRTHEECDSMTDAHRHSLFQFQSTHSRGVRPRFGSNGSRRSGFQSTHSRGVRLRCPVRLVTVLSFNPRTHEECDQTYY